MHTRGGTRQKATGKPSSTKFMAAGPYLGCLVTQQHGHGQRIRKRPANDNRREHRQTPGTPQNTSHTRTAQVTTGPRQRQDTQRGRQSASGMQKRKSHTRKG